MLSIWIQCHDCIDKLSDYRYEYQYNKVVDVVDMST